MSDPAAKDDPLLRWREEFPALEDCVYMISHSLGCLPIKAAEYMEEFLELWHKKSINAWDDWLGEVDRAAARIGRLLSAPEGSVTMFTNVSLVNAVLASCFEYTPERNKIVYTSLEFPSVSYVWKAEERRGARVHIVESADNVHIDTQAMLDAIDEQTVCVPISHVIFRSSYIQDVEAIARKAASVGAHVILDCYQSLGVIPVDVVSLGVSFACGGSVKYMCGGPGAAYLYVRPDLIERFEPRVTGWFGNEAPFAFTMPGQTYAETIWRYMGGTPAIAPLYQARAGAEIIGEIGARAIRDKSQRSTRRVIERVDERGFTLNSPRDDARRAGSVVFDFTGAADVARELNRRRFFCDHRPGAGIRIAPHFYNTEEEIDLFFEEIDLIRKGGQRA
ncbi:MAG TPA: aminotransferase class V-fold PLP-dependent enzyme [Kofleriaceae bacterium]|nr:aminotransferase class V-fold PLP-dependent enzyme [Kofleriaceae bacterium]